MPARFLRQPWRSLVSILAFITPGTKADWVLCDGGGHGAPALDCAGALPEYAVFTHEDVLLVAVLSLTAIVLVRSLLWIVGHG